MGKQSCPGQLVTVLARAHPDDVGGAVPLIRIASARLHAPGWSPAGAWPCRHLAVDAGPLSVYGQALDAPAGLAEQRRRGALVTSDGAAADPAGNST